MYTFNSQCFFFLSISWLGMCLVRQDHLLQGCKPASLWHSTLSSLPQPGKLKGDNNDHVFNASVLQVIGRSSRRRPVSFTSFHLLYCQKRKLFCSFHVTMEKKPRRETNGKAQHLHASVVLTTGVRSSVYKQVMID